MRRRVGAAGLVGVALLALWWWRWPAADRAGEVPGGSEEARRRDPSAGVADPDPGAASGGEEGADGSRAEGDLLGGAGGPDGQELTDEQLAARAKELEDAPETHVICELGIPLRHGQAYLAIGDPREMNGRMVEVVNGKAYLPLVYDLGELGDAVFDERDGVFALDGYGPQAISWSDRPEGGKGRCTAPIRPEPGRASLTGTLTLAETGRPAAGAWVEGCGNLAFADGSGIVHMDILPDPCSVVAMRQDGALRLVSEPVAVVPRPGEDVVVDLTLPEAPKAGLGIRIAEAEGGMRIEGVVDGGPAQAAGLEAGDVVVGVDGRPASELSIAEFVSLAGGPAGSQVVLEVQRGGERLALTVTRGPVPG